MGAPPLTSKLHPPRRRRGHVRRSALLDAIRVDDPDLVLVTAPAGYGKSTLLAELVETDERPFAWLTVDSAHNDSGLLLADVAYALQQIEPVDPALLAQLPLQPAAIAGPTFQGFARMLGARTRPFVLVLDDVHELVTRDALDALSLLIAEIPTGSMLALGGRTRPALPFGRIRTAHVAVEVGIDDLALDVAGAMAMCAELAIDLGDEDVALLVERTEGWPLALYLAVLAPGVRARSEAAERLGDTRPMVEYFSDVFLSGLDPDVESLLLGVAPLDRFSGPLCDNVFGRDGSATVLEDLHRRNLLVIALDDRREWYRLHKLFAEFLSTELDRRDASATRAVLMGASRWHENHADIDAAIACAARAGDMQRTAALVADHFARYASNGRQATIERWLSWFSPDDLEAHPLLMTAAAMAGLTGGDGPAVVSWLDRATTVIGDARPADAGGWVPPVALAGMRAAGSWLTASEMAAEAEYAHGQLPAGADWQPMTCLAWGAAAFMLGDEERAESLLRDSIRGAVGRPVTQSIAIAHLAVMQLEQGRWDLAAELASQARAVVADRLGLPVTCLVTATSALVLMRGGRADEALADHQMSRRHLAGLTDAAPWLNLQTRIALARASVLAGRQIEADTLADEIASILATVPDAVRVSRQLADLRRSFAAKTNKFGPASLTTAELRVLQYLPTHLSIAEVADRLYLSRNTVKTHTIAIYRKLGTSSRSSAVDLAREAGLLP
jgi:LuxR family maltose regulon positive regulatory protein